MRNKVWLGLKYFTAFMVSRIFTFAFFLFSWNNGGLPYHGLVIRSFDFSRIAKPCITRGKKYFWKSLRTLINNRIQIESQVFVHASREKIPERNHWTYFVRLRLVLFTPAFLCHHLRRRLPRLRHLPHHRHGRRSQTSHVRIRDRYFGERLCWRH